MAEIPERWIRAETYPIEGFWSTQILLDRKAEVVCIANGHTEEQSIERAVRIVAAEARVRELEQALQAYRTGHAFCIADPEERDLYLDHDPCEYCRAADALLLHVADKAAKL